MKTRSREVCTELTSHSMVRDLHRMAIPLIADQTQTKTLTAADSYNLDLFDATGALIQSFDLLELSRNFARPIPSANYLTPFHIRSKMRMDVKAQCKFWIGIAANFIGIACVVTVMKRSHWKR